MLYGMAIPRTTSRGERHMKQSFQPRHEAAEVQLIERIVDLALMPERDLPQAVRDLARLSLLDWLVCARAGTGQPLSAIIRSMIAHEGGVGVSTVAGGPSAPARAAALVNGAVGHALDYDDTHFAHIGHPSAAIYPAALAAGEMVDSSAEAVCTAFAVGAEASIRIGCVLGAAHYDRGFHQTATAGAFGATVAAARILGLTRSQIRSAMGLCATRASGLRCQFGTMGKPYNAGIGAANGIECALLARAGFTAPDDGLMGPQGFIPTHSEAPRPEAAYGPKFQFEDIQYKLHACCHGTHAMIEALRAVVPVAPERIAKVVVETSPRWLTVCNIRSPRTGLEVKFSYTWLAAMVLHGRPTQDPKLFTDALTVDALLAEISRRIEVVGNAELTETQVEVEVVTTDGQRQLATHDLAARMPPAELHARLIDKTKACLGAESEHMIAKIDQIEELSAREIGALLNPLQGAVT